MSLSLPDWSTLADTDDAQWPLLAAVLRVAADEYPGLDAQACAAQLQAHADSLATEVASISSLPLKMAAINRYLFQEQGYGPADDYYAADNNHLQQVLARRRGNPIAAWPICSWGTWPPPGMTWTPTCNGNRRHRTAKKSANCCAMRRFLPGACISVPAQSSTNISKSCLPMPQSGQHQSAGTSAQRVPGAMPSSGRPSASL